MILHFSVCASWRGFIVWALFFRLLVMHPDGTRTSAAVKLVTGTSHLDFVLPHK